jgi:phage gp46-like protein
MGVWGSGDWGEMLWGDSANPPADAYPYGDRLISLDGYSHTIGDAKDNVLDARGHLERDYTVASRARFRLLCRRGEWVHDPDCGSRFHLIKTLREGQAKAQAYAAEALRPLVSEGSIVSVEVGAIEQDPDTGTLAVEIAITLTSGRVADIGSIRMGS